MIDAIGMPAHLQLDGSPIRWLSSQAQFNRIYIGRGGSAKTKEL